MLKIYLIFVIFFVISCSAFPFKSRKPILDGRIIGGDVTPIEEIPYQIALLFLTRITCGGSIVASSWILTAAHCVRGWPLEYFSVRVGSQWHANGGEVIAISEVVLHDDFNATQLDYDFALLHLARPITFDATKQPVRLPLQNDILANETMTLVSGWGATGISWESDRLRSIKVPIVDNETCDKAYVDFGGVTDRMICAGLDEGGMDACQGDSGGPLSVDGILYGLVSWGFGCAKPGYPGVYSNVAAVSDWILKNIQN